MDTSERTRRTASGLLAATGALHLILAPEYLGEQAYVGVLFILGGIAALALALRLWNRSDTETWAASAALAGGMAVGFILSRTVGLPGFYEEEWELSGIVSVLLEAGVVAYAAGALRQRIPSTA